MTILVIDSNKVISIQYGLNCSKQQTSDEFHTIVVVDGRGGFIYIYGKLIYTMFKLTIIYLLTFNLQAAVLDLDLYGTISRTTILQLRN